MKPAASKPFRLVILTLAFIACNVLGGYFAFKNWERPVQAMLILIVILYLPLWFSIWRDSSNRVAKYAGSIALLFYTAYVTVQLLMYQYGGDA
jgi:hydrogenase/urease accessory protein HupE